MNTIKIGNEVYIMAGAVYVNNNKTVPETLLNTKVFVRNINNNICTVARAKTGPVLGDIAMENLKSAEENEIKINPYIIQIPAANIPLYHSASKNSGIIRRLSRFELITIVDEKNGFGKIKVGAGWVELAKVNKIV
jgi:hypothetical protein